MRRETMRRAALTACLTPHALECNMLGTLSDREWTVLLRWLHVSGLALYLFERLTTEDRTDYLPSFVLASLHQNVVDNVARTRSMIEELAEISASFKASQLCFAVLKGLSLCPISVPSPWLRSQADIDFLVATHHAPRAAEILHHCGFRLHAINGRNWEFRTGAIHTATFRNMYRAVPFRSVELHLEAAGQTEDSLLGRTENFTYGGLTLPALGPVDLMLGQALHLYKHVCGEFFRAAHVLEFHSHVVARTHDREFWQRLRGEASRSSIAPLKLGVVTLLTSRVCGYACAAATEHLAWSIDRLPSAARLWVERYGEHAAFVDAPGSKLFLLLETAMTDAGIPARRPALRVLLPRNLPRLTTPPPHESWPDRLRRYRLQLCFVRARLHFHIVEGLRYLHQSIAWSRELSRIEAHSNTPQQTSDNSLTHA